MKRFVVGGDYKGWPRGWWLGPACVPCDCCRQEMPRGKPRFSPGEGKGLFCTSCGAGTCTEEEYEEVLEWLEDQAEIADAEAKEPAPGGYAPGYNAKVTF